METGGLNQMSNFEEMSIKELKEYLKHNQGNTKAFHVLMDKLNTRPNQQIYSANEVDKLEELIANNDSKNS